MDESISGNVSEVDEVTAEPNGMTAETAEGSNTAEGTAAEQPALAGEDNDDIDYAAVVARDVAELRSQFSELSELTNITELANPMRYAALRDLGLTAAEAYLATSPRAKRADTRAHLTGTVPKGASLPRGSMSSAELDAARDIFTGMSDAQIQALYKKVTR